MQKLQLAIPEPCHENWHQMTPTDQGRFCNACAKEVIDFSMMTDTEILNYFTTITHEKVCGRALPSQLERTISKPKDPKKRLFWYWNYIVMFFMFFGKGNSAKAQGAIKPVTQINPVKTNDIRGEIATVNVTKQQGTRVISGKVTDKYGNPISFASVKMKGTPGGVSADANGAYSLKVNSNTILIICGGGFKDVEVMVGLQSNVNTILEKDPYAKEVVVTIAGGIRRKITGSVSAAITTVNPSIVFEIKEDYTSLPIDKAAITITRKGDNLSEKSFSDKKGIYEFKQIKLNDSYFVKIEAEGYEPNEFTIDGKDLKDIKKEWEVLLRKQKTEVVQSTAIANRGKETKIWMRCENSFELGKDTLYVVDGTIKSYKPEINPDDIEDYSVLPGPAAAALFGPEGANGAIVITTRKAKEIKLKEVVVTSGTMMGGIRNVTISETTIIEKCEILVDTVKTFVTNLTGAIKIYPNPVQRGNEINIALKLKQTGVHQIQIMDATGRIVLLKQINATAKQSTEKIIADARWSSGMYYISITDAKNKLINKSSFIVQ